MAVTNEKSVQMTNLDAVPRKELPANELGGRVRAARFDFTQGAAAGDPGSTADLCKLPARARVLAGLSYIRWSAFGAARTLDIGTRAHKNAQTGADIAANAARFVSALDVSAAGFATLASNAQMAGDTDTVLGEAVVYATVAGGTIPAGATLKGEIVYVVD